MVILIIIVAVESKPNRSSNHCFNCYHM